MCVCVTFLSPLGFIVAGFYSQKLLAAIKKHFSIRLDYTEVFVHIQIDPLLKGSRGIILPSVFLFLLMTVVPLITELKCGQRLWW